MKPRAIDRGLVPLSFLQWSISLFGFVAIVAAYLAALTFLLGQMGA
jgi:hypothetical protein